LKKIKTLRSQRSLKIGSVKEGSVKLSQSALRSGALIVDPEEEAKLEKIDELDKIRDEEIEKFMKE